jgi:hypothetical protein
LESITRFIFHPDDDPLLEYLEDDGQRIEPEYYVPIIPMALVNGSEGIGTGWSSSVPTYNPREIINNLRLMIEGETPREMVPWFRGFIGKIEKVGEKSVKASASAKARWNKAKDANALPAQSDSNATHNTLPITQDTKQKKENKRGSRLAQDFCLTKDWIEFCVSQRPDLHPAQTFDQFKDYWTSQAGQKGVKLDWFATWRNWVRSTHAPKRNPADIVRITVPSKNEPDPELEKIKADDKKAVPIPLEVLAKMAQLRRKA